MHSTHHGHAEHEWGDVVDGRLGALVQCVEQICPAHNPQQEAEHLRAEGEREGHKHTECFCSGCSFSRSLLLQVINNKEHLKMFF